MKIGSLAAAATFGLMILLAQGVAAEAAEVQVLSAVAMRAVMNELGLQSCGHVTNEAICYARDYGA